jgi:hypothetical protein
VLIFAAAMIAFQIIVYAYAMRYRVSVDARRGITIVSVFRSRFVAFSDIAAIATMRGKRGGLLAFLRQQSVHR